MRTSIEHGEAPSRDLREWLEEFIEHLFYEEVSASSEAPASISREPLYQELARKVVSGKYSTFTHFPKDRNCEVCKKRTKITRAPCRRRTGNSVLLAQKFGD